MGIEEIGFCSCQEERDIFHVYVCVCVGAPGAVLEAKIWNSRRTVSKN